MGINTLTSWKKAALFKENVSPKLTTSTVGLFLCPFARFS